MKISDVHDMVVYDDVLALSVGDQVHFYTLFSFKKRGICQCLDEVYQIGFLSNKLLVAFSYAYIEVFLLSRPQRPFKILERHGGREIIIDQHLIYVVGLNVMEWNYMSNTFKKVFSNETCLAIQLSFMGWIIMDRDGSMRLNHQKILDEHQCTFASIKVVDDMIVMAEQNVEGTKINIFQGAQYLRSFWMRWSFLPTLQVHKNRVMIRDAFGYQYDIYDMTGRFIKRNQSPWHSWRLIFYSPNTLLSVEEDICAIPVFEQMYIPMISCLSGHKNVPRALWERLQWR